MDKIELNETKINSYAKVQSLLIGLTPNSSDEEISSLFKQIPPDLLNQKEDLMMICELIARYAHDFSITTKGNAIKLMERLIPSIKTLLPNESVFFWSIYDDIFWMKLWLYEECIISINQIISVIFDEESTTEIEYFLPEIIEKAPELFEKEVKQNIILDYSADTLQKFVELRKKYFHWLRNSNDFHDSLYKEIEKDKLRLAIKTDDIDSFQRILAHSNISIDSNIQESILEYYPRKEMSLIQFAIHCNSIKIIKYLLMNDAKISDKMCFFHEVLRNVDIIHLLENKMKDNFANHALNASIVIWNIDLVEYSINNHGFSFIEESNVDQKYDKQIINIFIQSIYSLNFIFWEKFFLPFLRNNPDFIKRNISLLICETFTDHTCFFASAFLKYPGIDINFVNDEESYLKNAISESNINAIKLLLKNPNIDINLEIYSGITAFQYAVYKNKPIEILEILSKVPSIDINKIDELTEFNSLTLAAYQHNFFTFNFITNNFPNTNLVFPYMLMYSCISNNKYYCLEIVLKYFINQKNPKTRTILKYFKMVGKEFDDYTDEMYNNFKIFLFKIKGKNINEYRDYSDDYYDYYYNDYKYSDDDDDKKDLK